MAILIHPDTSEKQFLLEDLLKKMKISFESTESNERIKVSNAEMESIKKGLEQANNGELISSKEIHEKARLLCSK